MLKFKGQKKDPFVPPLSISTIFDLSCFGHNSAVVINQKELSVTRRELKQDRKTLAKAFLALGVKKGDIITVATGRSMYDNVLIFLAANRIGAVVAFLDEKTPKDILLKYLDEFKSETLFVYDKTDAKIKELKSEARTVKNVVNLTHSYNDEKNVDQPTVISTFYLGKTPLTKIAGRWKKRIPLNVFGGKNEALISFTSGSTSGPKPMVFTNENLIAAALFSKAASGIKMWDKNVTSWFSFVKFDCPYGFWTSVMTPIIGGSKVILTPDLNENNFEYYFKKDISVIQAVPLLFEMLPEILPKDMDLSHVKMCISGGERLEKRDSENILAYFREHGANVKICNGYGVGECLGSITVAVGSTYRPDTVGRVVPGAHVMVLNPETEEELGFSKTGILYVSGKHVLKRYFNRPELDEEKIKNIGRRKFVKTGDLAMVSEDGFVTLVGRATFFINTVPAKVYYELVRMAISRCDLIAKCYVVKMPDKKMGWSACAFVVVKDGVRRNNDTRRVILEDAARVFYLGRSRLQLKDYEIPKKIVFLDELPLTKANKTDFRKLEQMAKEIAKGEK